MDMTHVLIDSMVSRLEELKKKEYPHPKEFFEDTLDMLLHLTASIMGSIELNLPVNAHEHFEDAVVADMLGRVKEVRGYAKKIMPQPGNLKGLDELIEDCDNCPEKATCPSYRAGGYTLADRLAVVKQPANA